MINIPRWEQRLDSYHKALARLAEIVGASKKRALNGFERDGLVQRFEFTHELSWKLMKAYTEYQGYDGIGGSRDATRKAFEMSLISDGQSWMDMIKSRSDAAHNYEDSVIDVLVDAVINRIILSSLIFVRKWMRFAPTLTPDEWGRVVYAKQ